MDILLLHVELPGFETIYPCQLCKIARSHAAITEYALNPFKQVKYKELNHK